MVQAIGQNRTRARAIVSSFFCLGIAVVAPHEANAACRWTSGISGGSGPSGAQYICDRGGYQSAPAPRRYYGGGGGSSVNVGAAIGAAGAIIEAAPAAINVLGGILDAGSSIVSGAANAVPDVTSGLPTLSLPGPGSLLMPEPAQADSGGASIAEGCLTSSRPKRIGGITGYCQRNDGSDGHWHVAYVRSTMKQGCPKEIDFTYFDPDLQQQQGGSTLPTTGALMIQVCDADPQNIRVGKASGLFPGLALPKLPSAAGAGQRTATIDRDAPADDKPTKKSGDRKKDKPKAEDSPLDKLVRDTLNLQRQQSDKTIFDQVHNKYRDIDARGSVGF